MNQTEIQRAIECMREDGYSDQEIETELEVSVKPYQALTAEAEVLSHIEVFADVEDADDAEWVSCADCDALPGDPCKLSAEDVESAITIHHPRIDHMYKFASDVDR